jgi:NADPH-dependent curcumin reductase
MPILNRKWVLKRRPVGAVSAEDLELIEAPAPLLEDGQFLARTIYLSLDPAQRISMSDRTQYSAPVKIGDVMRGSSLSVVESSRNPRFSPGDIVRGPGGWQAYWVGRDATKIVVGDAPLSAHLSVLGVTGATAYFGLLDVAQARSGETVVVSAAAGAVGSIVGQIAKLTGCRAVGLAGSDEKCRHVVEVLGFDAGINYRTEDLHAALGRDCPDGIDVDFENVGGAIFDAILDHVNLHARVALCGLISTYNAVDPAPGPSNFASILMKRVRVEGFIIGDYLSRMDEFNAQMTTWLAEGKIKHDVHVVRGLENAVDAMGLLFSGGNVGKLLLEVSAPEG